MGEFKIFYIKNTGDDKHERYSIYRKRKYWFDKYITSFQSLSGAHTGLGCLEYVYSLRLVGRSKKELT